MNLDIPSSIHRGVDAQSYDEDDGDARQHAPRRVRANAGGMDPNGKRARKAFMSLLSLMSPQSRACD
eukprot:3507206-Pyramimonas_sp.AAC.1